MKEKSHLLDEVMVAAPCNADWETMNGDDRVRFCQLCQLNVFNISSLSKDEAEALLRSKTENPSERLCLRLYRREDGTVLTSDCPVGIEKFKLRMEEMRKSRHILVRAAAAAALLAVSLVSYTQTQAQAQGEDKNQAQCKTQSQNQSQNQKPNQPQNNLQNMARMGDVAYPVQPAKMGEAVARPVTGQPVANPILGQMGAPGKGQSPEKPESGDADRTAQNFLNEARRSVAAGKFSLAETNFKQAIKAASDKKHDPKFRDSIKKEYADFLKKQKKEGK